MKKYFFDTNFLFGLFSESDALYERATEFFLKLPADADLLTSSLVLAELICSGEPTDFLYKLKTLEIKILDSDLSTVIAMSKLIPPQKRRKIKAIDSIIITQAAIEEAELVSFDEGLQKVID